MCGAVLISAISKSQIRSGYFMNTYIMSHEINPALQPDSGYMSIPVLGYTYMNMQSTIGLSDILFETADGTMTTFMSKGSIDKEALMDKIGNGVKANATSQLTLLSMGQRINRWRYWTANLSIKAKANTWISKGLFDCMKDIENRDYNIGDVKCRATAYAELSFGESSHWTEQLDIGGKIKLLVGLMNADANVSGLKLNTKGNNEWTVNGTTKTNIAGLKYTTEEKEYESRPGTYHQVNGIKFAGLKPCGIGFAIDLGMAYKIEDRWTLSAAVSDFGFITWTNNNRAQNTETSFRFGGFHDIEAEKGEENSLKNQWNRISDSLTDLVHLEESGKKTYTQMLGATFTAGAEYDMSSFTGIKLGALLTHRLNGSFSWTELRANGIYTFNDTLPLDISISPAFSTFGVSLGLMATYKPSARTTIFLGSDHIFTKVNPQLIPNDLNGGLCFGMSLQM